MFHNKSYVSPQFIGKKDDEREQREIVVSLDEPYSVPRWGTP
jgi:hypothetical protein